MLYISEKNRIWVLAPTVDIVYVTWRCVYCGTETKDACCDEVHHETGYVECDKNLDEVGSCVILESELNEKHEVVE